MVNAPFDFFTLAHGFVGFVFGKLKLNRWLCYAIAIGWEIFQFYFQHKPKGFILENIWLDSVVDIISLVVCYEVTVNFQYLRGIYNKSIPRQWKKNR